jgi:hypothetical protein
MKVLTFDLHVDVIDHPAQILGHSDVHTRVISTTGADSPWRHSRQHVFTILLTDVGAATVSLEIWKKNLGEGKRRSETYIISQTIVMPFPHIQH